MKENKKQFPLDSKANCCIYLCRIISSCEICMDRLKEYNNKLKTDLEKYSQGDLIPHDIYNIAVKLDNLLLGGVFIAIFSDLW